MKKSVELLPPGCCRAQQGLVIKPDGTTPLSGQQADDIRAGPDRSHRHGGRPDWEPTYTCLALSGSPSATWSELWLSGRLS